MGKRAKAGTDFRTLVRMALPLLKKAQQQCPRTGPGAKPKLADWLIASLIMIALLNGKKTKSAQYRFLCRQWDTIAGWIGDGHLPARATYFRRYRRAHRLYRQAIRLQGQRAIAEGVTQPKHVAVDKSLIAAHGPPWHKQDRQAGKIPAGVDTDTTWGYSEHDGWVQGYSYEVIVTSTPHTTVFPLLASVDTASVSEPRSCMDKVNDLPATTKTVSADSGYDANYLGERIEYDDQNRRTGRRFLCPENPRNQRPQIQPYRADPRRDRSRQLRRQRWRFLRSPQGRRLYARRKKTVEPFNQWFKALFELETKVWHRGLDNNRTQLLAAIFIYQLLVRYNHRRGNQNGRLRWILDGL